MLNLPGSVCKIDVLKHFSPMLLVIQKNGQMLFQSNKLVNAYTIRRVNVHVWSSNVFNRYCWVNIPKYFIRLLFLCSAEDLKLRLLFCDYLCFVKGLILFLLFIAVLQILKIFILKLWVWGKLKDIKLDEVGFFNS